MFPDSASTYASDIDGLIIMIAVIVFAWFFLAEGVLFFFIFKFKAKKDQKGQYITGEKKEEKKWINIPHALVLLFDVLIIVAAINVWMTVKQTLPEPDRVIGVIGQQWAWTFEHPGKDGELGTKDDIVLVDELHVEVGKVYHFNLESKDVLHSFSVPVFRLKQDAVPGRTITGWFEATMTGTYDIQCAEMCGIRHGIMGAKLVLETPEEHAAWLASQSQAAATPQAATP